MVYRDRQALFFPRGHFEVLAQNYKKSKLRLPGDQILLVLMSSDS